MHYAKVTHKGLVRNSNQDRILVHQEAGIFLLADGVGGHNAGEVAAKMAVDTVAAELQRGHSLVEAIATANDAISDFAKAESRYFGMGTTILALVVAGNEYEVAWLGDSRAYKIGAKIRRLTTDHTLAQGLVDKGSITEEEAALHPGRNTLTRALGIAGRLLAPPGTTKGRLARGEVLLLCSDGLHGMIDDEKIVESVLSSENLESAVQSLLDSALNAGGTDNISIVAVSV